MGWRWLNLAGHFLAMGGRAIIWNVIGLIWVGAAKSGMSAAKFKAWVRNFYLVETNFQAAV